MSFLPELCLLTKNDCCSVWAHLVKLYFVQEGEQHTTVDVRCRTAGESTRLYTILLSSLNVCTKSLPSCSLPLICGSVKTFLFRLSLCRHLLQVSDPVVSILQVPPMGLFYPSLLSLEEFSLLSRPWFVFLVHYSLLHSWPLFFWLAAVCTGSYS